MRISRCDRCGTEVEGRDAPSTWSVVIFGSGGRRELRPRAELCGDCSEAFRRWLSPPPFPGETVVEELIDADDDVSL